MNVSVPLEGRRNAESGGNLSAEAVYKHVNFGVFMFP